MTLVEHTRSFEGVAGFNAFYGPGDIQLGGSGDPERITGVPVTQLFFPLLGVSAVYGRFFDDAEEFEGEIWFHVYVLAAGSSHRVGRSMR